MHTLSQNLLGTNRSALWLEPCESLLFHICQEGLTSVDPLSVCTVVLSSSLLKFCCAQMISPTHICTHYHLALTLFMFLPQKWSLNIKRKYTQCHYDWTVICPLCPASCYYESAFISLDCKDEASLLQSEGRLCGY